MPILLNCLCCNKGFLMLPANTDIDQLELDWQRVAVECPHCQFVNQAFLSSIKQHLEKVQSPNTISVGAEDFENQSDYLDSQQMMLDFEEDYLCPVDDDGVKKSTPRKNMQIAGYRPGDVYDGAGYLIARVGPAEPST